MLVHQRVNIFSSPNASHVSFFVVQDPALRRGAPRGARRWRLRVLGGRTLVQLRGWSQAVGATSWFRDVLESYQQLSTN